jgi:hypothetical protein
MKKAASFSVGTGLSEDGTVCFWLKIQTNDVEMNVLATADDLKSLASIREADWNLRRSIRAGSIGSLAVFWCSDEDYLTVLAGSDDESWDISLSLPVESIADLLLELDSVHGLGT